MLAYSATLVLSLAASVYAQAATSGATISTPAALITCQPVALNWSGGAAPYFLSIIPGGDSASAALVQLGEQAGNSFSWTVNVAAGTSVSLAITDSAGVTNYSSPLTIQAGSSTACVGEDAAAPSGGAPAGTSAAAGSSTRANTSAGASSVRPSTTGGSAAAPAASTTAATGGAASNTLSAAGVLAAVAVVLAL